MAQLNAAREFLKCDTPTCDFYELIPVVIENVGLPCPKCGANLLTKEDFLTFRIMAAGINAANEIVLAANPDAPMSLMATHVHGDRIESKIVESEEINPFPNGDA